MILLFVLLNSNRSIINTQNTKSYNHSNVIHSKAIRLSIKYFEMIKKMQFEDINKETVYRKNMCTYKNCDSNLIELSCFLQKNKDSLTYNFNIDSSAFESSIIIVYVTIKDSSYLNYYHGFLSFTYIVYTTNKLMLYSYGGIGIPVKKESLEVSKRSIQDVFEKMRGKKIANMPENWENTLDTIKASK